MAFTKGLPMSPNLLDLRSPVSPESFPSLFSGSNPIPGVTDAWRNQTIDRYVVQRDKQTSWAKANDLANRRKLMEKETGPTALKDRKELRDRVLDEFFGDPMRIGKEREEFLKRMSDITTSFGKSTNNGW